MLGRLYTGRGSKKGEEEGVGKGKVKNCDLGGWEVDRGAEDEVKGRKGK